MAELYVKSLSSGKKVWMRGEKEDGKSDIKPKIEVKNEAEDQEEHQLTMDTANQSPIPPSNAPISHPLESASAVDIPLTTSAPNLPTSPTVSVVTEEEQMTMNGGESMALTVVDKEKPVTDAPANDLMNWKETAQAKERESQLKDRLLESKDTVIAMWKEKYEHLEMKLKQREEAEKVVESRSVGAATLESAMLTDSMENEKETPPTEQQSRAARAAQLLGVPFVDMEPPNKWKDKCEQFERLYRAEQKTTATLRRELMEMGRKVKKEAVAESNIQLDDAESNEAVTSPPLDPVQLEGRKRRQKQQLKRMKERNATTVNGGIQSAARGDKQEESDGNVAMTTTGKSTLGSKTSGASRRRSTAAAIGVFPCAKCPHHVAFASAQLLEQHQQRRHSDRHRFPCDQCPQSFTKIGDLNVHKKQVHSGVKPFTCSFCEKRFAVKSHLTVHKRVHTGERPYVCTVCQKAFADQSALRNHERTHSGEKPYCCKHCGKKFTQTSTCWKHQKSCRQRTE